MPYIKCPECDGTGFANIKDEEGNIKEEDCLVCEGHGKIFDEQIRDEEEFSNNIEPD